MKSYAALKAALTRVNLQPQLLDELSLAISTPISEWPLDPYKTCCRIADVYPDRGLIPVWGHYVGPAMREHVLGTDYQVHAWLRIPDNTILDFTCWHYLGVKPYIRALHEYNSHFESDYDAGAEAYLSKQGLPSFSGNFPTSLAAQELHGQFPEYSDLFGGAPSVVWTQLEFFMANYPQLFDPDTANRMTEFFKRNPWFQQVFKEEINGAFR